MQHIALGNGSRLLCSSKFPLESFSSNGLKLRQLLECGDEVLDAVLCGRTFIDESLVAVQLRIQGGGAVGAAAPPIGSNLFF